MTTGIASRGVVGVAWEFVRYAIVFAPTAVSLVGGHSLRLRRPQKCGRAT